MKLRYLKRLFLACMLLVPLTCSARSFPDSFDTILQDSAQRYMPRYDWYWWRAQCYQESLLNPNAVSPAGAMGLAQIMPKTWVEQSRMMGINASPYNPRANALVGAAYMQRMLGIWKTSRPPLEHLRWAQASYNCGPGCVLAAQKRANGETIWWIVSRYVPLETREYVLRIDRWYGEMAR